MSKFDTTRQGVVIYRLMRNHMKSKGPESFEELDDFIQDEFSRFGEDAPYGAIVALTNLVSALLWAWGKNSFEGDFEEVLDQSLQRLAYGLQMEEFDE